MRALSKESKRVKTPSNISTQMSGNEVLPHERCQAAQLPENAVTWGLQIHDSALGET